MQTHLGHLERHAVPLAQLLQLGDHAVGHARRALRVQAVHHARHQVDLRGAPTAVINSLRRSWYTQIGTGASSQLRPCQRVRGAGLGGSGQLGAAGARLRER
jgi:hypothetical protein